MRFLQDKAIFGGGMVCEIIINKMLIEKMILLYFVFCVVLSKSLFFPIFAFSKWALHFR